MLLKKYPIKSDTELFNCLIEISNSLLSSLVELNALEKVSHNDLKGLKTLFSITRTLHALPFVTTHEVLNGLFESITSEVVKLSEKFKQVLTYWNKNLLAAEFNQNMKSNHIIKTDDDKIKIKESNGKSESNGTGKVVKKSETDSETDMNAKQRKNLKRKDKSVEKKDKKVKANPEDISAKAKKSQKNFKRKMDLLNKKKKK